MKLERHCRAVVTGGASGLGRELCLELAKRGAKIWITDLSEAEARQAATECLIAGASEAFGVACDVRKVSDFESLAEKIRAHWGGIDFLVNNAGVAIGGMFEDYSLEDWKWTLDTNLMGVIHGCHLFYPMMREQGHGAILNIASAAGLLNPPGMAAYNVSKAGVVALSETLSAEALSRNISVTVACPTFFKSGLFDKGRFLGSNTKEQARRYFAGAKTTVNEVAKRCLSAVEARALYALPMWDGRLLWIWKRLTPRFFGRSLAKALAKKSHRVH